MYLLEESISNCRPTIIMHHQQTFYGHHPLTNAVYDIHCSSFIMRPLFVSLLLLACLVDEHRFFVMSLTASPCIRIPRMVMVDRDGVVNEDVGAPGVLRVSDFCLTPNAGISIGNLKRAGCIVVVVTNQSCGASCVGRCE
jgi:hypothetical protein